MKQRSLRNTRTDGKEAASQRRTKPSGERLTADQLHASPALAAQRKQLERAFGGHDSSIVQRVKDMPDHETLKKAVAGYVSSEMGSCCGATASVFKLMKQFVDDASECGALVMTWAENAQTELDIGNHTACTVTWTQRTFVIDTTAAQFGGPEIFIGSPSEWQGMILDLQKCSVSHESCVAVDKPLSEIGMMDKALDLKLQFGKPKLPDQRIKSKPASKDGMGEQGKNEKDGKGGGKDKKCYLTTACVEHHGLPDDCQELRVLRAFRDGWLVVQPGGEAAIEAYYRKAPSIVEAIDASGMAVSLYRRMFRVIQQCVRAIEDQRPHEAWRTYAQLVRVLERIS